MINASFFDDLAKKINSIIPPALQDIRGETEKNIKSALQTGFSKLDLVTREEFDKQSELLSKARIKLEALEKRLDK